MSRQETYSRVSAPLLGDGVTHPRPGHLTEFKRIPERPVNQRNERAKLVAIVMLVVSLCVICAVT